ncbi:acetyl-CoA acyltransferase [Diaminobutyricimonas aerilata]|uniref:Acetyl-CoA acyltransferase n=1 Tax=Diaminobutyricimonas aerilata TaxID=1162967 RepID=A0A2M9CLT0_9MICO|nr:acetyl-CoA C-acyltransferase [Diaminobutyricimonas aerilata]PJJ72846.1 acetyl-CoA acyltransferase [Diaminobutyricimonas aerilata]
MVTAVIVDAVRTASGRGKPGGALAHHHPADLLGRVLRALVDRHGLDPALIDDVIGGCLGQIRQQAVNVTRNAVLSAGFPETVPATTIDRQCGSSQQAVHFAAQGVAAGAYDLVIACGVELMSTVPIGAATLGEDPYGPRIAERYPGGLVGQGISAELISARWGLERDELDAYAARSHALAAAADFSGEILPVDGHASDETVRPGTTVEALAGLRPAFEDERMRERFPEIDWRITAGNSSPLTDGASAVLIASETAAERLGLPVRARFRAFDVIGSDPVEMLTAIIPATRRVLEKAGLGIDDIDAFEVNEAFAPVPLAWQRELGADPDRLNPRGGAIALGHALGSSGTRLLTTLLGTLESTGGRVGLQTMCEGGGMANALVLERV